MPEPHRGAHDGYLLRYLQTGIGPTLGTPREVFKQIRLTHPDDGCRIQIDHRPR
ncbi:MAG: hypothetical protein ABI614_12425 [Planctomycetota bacterium]